MTCVLLSAFPRENSGIGEGEGGGGRRNLLYICWNTFEPLFAILYFSYKSRELWSYPIPSQGHEALQCY